MFGVVSQSRCGVGHAGAPSLAARKEIVSESRNDADRAGGLFFADSCSAGSLCELEGQMVIGRCSLNGAGGVFYRAGDFDFAGSLCEPEDQMVIGRCSLSGAGGVFYRTGDFDFAGTRGLWAATPAHPSHGVSSRYWRLFQLGEL